MSTKKFFVGFFPNRTLGNTDAFIPLAYDMKSVLGNSLKLTFFINSKGVHNSLKKSPNIMSEIGSLGKISLPKESSLVNLAQLMIFLFSSLFYRALGYKVFFISSSVESLRNDIIIAKLIRLFGKAFSIGNINCPITEGYAQRRSVKGRTLSNKMDNLDKVPTDANNISRNTRLHYSDIEIAPLKQMFGPQVQLANIGVPKLYDSWQKKLKQDNMAAISQEMIRLGLPIDTDYIAILPTNPDYFWFDEGTSFTEMTKDVLLFVRERFPDTPIIIKPKLQHVDAVKQSISHHDDNIFFSTVPLFVLAAQAKIAYTIQETSGVFDFLSQGVPAIEYGKYSKEWREVQPIKSPWIEFPGFFYANSYDELETATSSALQSHSTSSIREELANYLQHENRWQTVLN